MNGGDVGKKATVFFMRIPLARDDVRFSGLVS